MQPDSALEEIFNTCQVKRIVTKIPSTIKKIITYKTKAHSKVLSDQ